MGINLVVLCEFTGGETLGGYSALRKSAANAIDEVSTFSGNRLLFLLTGNRPFPRKKNLGASPPRMVLNRGKRGFAEVLPRPLRPKQAALKVSWRAFGQSARQRPDEPGGSVAPNSAGLPEDVCAEVRPS